jgi:hypothetical protein
MIDVGSVLLGRYKLNARVGVGGMATVYDAEDLLLGRRVAVKIPLPTFAADPAFVARFENEARVAASLVHPSLVSVYDVGQDGDTRFMVMEFVEGETLRDLLRRESPLTPEDVVQVGSQVSDALEVAHRRGLVHRDVKPGNVLLTNDGRVKLADFGIALALGTDSATRTGVVLGSVQYLAPEVARGETATPLSDIYSLGVVLYEIGTGHLPYAGDTPVAIALQHVQSEPRRPTDWNPALPAALEAIMLRAMAKAPAARFATADELAGALRAFGRGEPVPGVAPLPSAGERAARAIEGTAPLATADPAATTPWTWGAPAGPSPWAVAAPQPVERTQPLPSVPAPAAPAAGWSPQPAPLYPSARWPLVLLGLLSVLCVLGLVPLGMLAYRQVRLPPALPRVTPRSGEVAPEVMTPLATLVWPVAPASQGSGAQRRARRAGAASGRRRARRAPGR